MGATIIRQVMHGGRIRRVGDAVEGDLADTLINLGAAWPKVEVKPEATDQDPTLGDGDAGQFTELVPIIAQLDPDNSEHFTKGGLPDVRILGERIGRPVSATERDDAWAAYKASQAE